LWQYFYDLLTYLLTYFLTYLLTYLIKLDALPVAQPTVWTDGDTPGSSCRHDIVMICRYDYS